jgi:hypothetical protein
MVSKKEEIKEEHETTIKTQPNELSSTRTRATKYPGQQQEQEQQHAVNRALDETKDNIRKTTDEARREIPRYTQLVNDYQEQTIQAAREIADNYIESQREIINSVQLAWIPYIENAYGTFWNYWMSPRRMTEIYGRMVSNFADNTVAATRVANNAVFVNMETTKTLMQNARDNAKEWSRAGVNTVKTLEQRSRETTRQDNDNAITRTNIETEWEEDDQRRRF